MHDEPPGAGPSDEVRASRQSRIDHVVDALCSPLEWQLETYGSRFRNMLLPSRHRVLECVEDLRGVLFPGFFGYREFREDTMRFHVGATLDRTLFSLQQEVEHACRFVAGWQYEREYAAVDQAGAIVDDLLAALPAIRQRLVLDAQACYEWDPAAFIPEAPLFCYPNMMAMFSYRLAHELYCHGVPFIPRIITEHAHSLTGIDIHPGAQIGERFFIDHGTGVVIGQTTVIGDRVRLYQGVTLGAVRFPLDAKTQRPLKGQLRHPIVEDDVVIYAEATILGRVTIGQGSVIGANVFLARSVPPGSKVFAAPVQMSRITDKDRQDGVAGG